MNLDINHPPLVFLFPVSSLDLCFFSEKNSLNVDSDYLLDSFEVTIVKRIAKNENGWYASVLRISCI